VVYGIVYGKHRVQLKNKRRSLFFPNIKVQPTSLQAVQNYQIFHLIFKLVRHLQSIYNRYRVNVSKTEEKIWAHCKGLVSYFDINLNVNLSFLLLSDAKKIFMFSRPKLDYTFSIEISVLFSKIESHDVLCLSWDVVRDMLTC
jgi:hypothetical protein